MSQKACLTCEKTFEPWRPSQSYCSPACHGLSKRGVSRKNGVAHRVVTAKGHPIAPPSGRVAFARLALYDKIGGGSHPCHWCEREVEWGAPRYSESALMADHLDWNPTNDEPDNLVPSCNQCNAHRRRNGGSAPIRDGELTVMWGGVRTRAVRRYCTMCGDGFLIPPSATKNGRGRFCSRSCARKGPRSSN